RHCGIRPDDHVGVCLSRSVDLAACLLGILKAGGAYVALEPTAHPERLAHMARDVGLKLVIGHPGEVNRLIRSDHAPCVETNSVDVTRQSVANLECVTSSNHLAYTIYTSGTTGTPKGVEITHRGIVRLVLGLECLPSGPSEVFLQLSSMSFDLST